jgi:hypothetical protein
MYMATMRRYRTPDESLGSGRARTTWDVQLTSSIIGQLRKGGAMSDGHWQLEGSAAELYQRYLVPGLPRNGRRILSIKRGFALARKYWMSRAAPAS